LVLRPFYQPREQLGETRLASHFMLSDAVNRHIERVKILVRIHQMNLGSKFLPAVESNHANLTDAAHPGIGRLYVD